MSAGLALPVLMASRSGAAGQAQITVGITVDTRPDWNGAENFIRSIDEASVELDRTGTTAKESCTIARKYPEDVIKLRV